MYKTIILFLFLCSGVYAQGIGTQAPDFTHATPDHGTIALSDYSGKIVYLFFFGWN